MTDKTYRRIGRRRLEAALRLQVRHPAPRPTVAPMMEPVPPEVIDLSTGAYRRHFNHEPTE